MQLSLQNFSTLVRNMSASAQASCPSLTDLATGSVTRALLEASASVALWLQYLLLQVMAMTRLATSNGADVDSWVGDFGLLRLPALAARGAVTFGCLAPDSQSAVIPVGTLVRTSVGGQSFAVVADPTNPAWSPTLAAYVRPIGTASITLPAQAVVAGSAGNVQAGTVNLLGQSVAGADTVSNAAGFTSGADQEADAALKARFVNYINTRSRATAGAIGSAIEGVQQGLAYAIEQNVDPSGAARSGFFTVVVDDGTGAPSAAVIAAVSAAVDLVRPVGTAFAVVGPQALMVDIALSLAFAPGADATALRAAAASAITGFVDTLSVGQVLPFSRVAALAYAAGPGVTNVEAVTVNGAAADVGGGTAQVVRLRSVTVS